MTASQLPLALIQLDIPPVPVRDRIGEQARWFIDALRLTPHDYVICRPDLGESLPDFNAVSGAILSGSGRWSPTMPNGASAPPHRCVRRQSSRCRCWASATAIS